MQALWVIVVPELIPSVIASVFHALYRAGNCEPGGSLRSIK